MFGLDDLKNPFQPQQFYGFMILESGNQHNLRKFFVGKMGRLSWHFVSLVCFLLCSRIILSGCNASLFDRRFPITLNFGKCLAWHVSQSWYCISCQ